MATIYEDFFLYSLKGDLIKWYDKHYYPPGYKGNKEVLEKHLTVLPILYEKYLHDGLEAQEIRVKILTKAQEIIDNSSMEDI